MAIFSHSFFVDGICNDYIFSIIFLQQSAVTTGLDLDDNATEFEFEESQSSQQSTSTNASKTTDQSQTKRKRKGRQTSDTDDEQAALVQRCEKILGDEEKPKDALNVFGDYVVSQLRRFENDELLQIETQNAIQKCLMDSTAKYVAKKYLFVDQSGILHPYNISTTDENVSSPSLLSTDSATEEQSGGDQMDTIDQAY